MAKKRGIPGFCRTKEKIFDSYWEKFVKRTCYFWQNYVQ